MDPTVIVDPEAAARAQRLQQELARRRRRRQVLAAVAAILLAFGGWFCANRWHSDGATRSGHLDYEFGAFTFHLDWTDSRVTMQWDGLREDLAGVEILESTDGAVWRSVEVDRLDLAARQVMFDLRSSLEGPLTIRVVPVLEGGHRQTPIQVSWMTGSGFSTPPVFRSTEDGTLLSWFPVGRNDEPLPIRFEYRVVLFGLRPSLVSADAGATSVSIPSVRNHSVVRLAVRSVFPDGQLGPWIEARPAEAQRSRDQKVVNS